MNPGRPGGALILSDDHEVFIVNVLLAGFADEEGLHEAHQDVRRIVRLETEPIEGADRA